MPSVENHVSFCVKEFGEENRELCYMVNSWMDAPSRELGSKHRIVRHDLLRTWQRLLIEHRCCENKMSFEDTKRLSDGLMSIDHSNLGKYFPKSQLILEMIIQHLKLDGILTPRQIEELHNEPLKVKVIYRRDTGETLLFVLPLDKKKTTPMWRRIAGRFGKKHEVTEEFKLSSMPVLTFNELGRLMYYLGYFTQEEAERFSAYFPEKPEPLFRGIRTSDDLLKFLLDRGGITQDVYEKLIAARLEIDQSIDQSMEPTARKRYGDLVFFKSLHDVGLIPQDWYKELAEAIRPEALSDEERATQEQCKELIELGFTTEGFLKALLIKGGITQKKYESFTNLGLTDYDFFNYLLDSGAVSREEFKDLIALARSSGITQDESK